MALDFPNGNEYVNHGSDTSLDVLDSQTWIWWVNPNVDTGSNMRLCAKLQGGTGLQVFVGDPFYGDGGVRVFRTRATTSTEIQMAAGTITAGSWQFLAWTDNDGLAGQGWHGDLTTRATEVSYNATSATASGAPGDESGGDLAIGSRAQNNTQSDWRIAMLWVYNVVLSEGDIIAHQFQPSLILPGCVLKTSYFDTVHLTDLSGNGNNGTLNGTPDQVDHVPLGPPFGFDVPWALPTAAAAGGSFPPRPAWIHRSPHLRM